MKQSRISKQFKIKQKTYPNDVKKEVPHFTLTKGTSKAIELLNESMYHKLFNPSVCPSEDIIFPYRLYYLFLNHPNLNIVNEDQFWKETCKYFTEENKGRAGIF